MKQLLIVSVEKFILEPGKRKCILKVQVPSDSSLSIPYDSLVESFRFLYGLDSIVVFTLEPVYGKD